jgi:hypothetical protein
LAVSWSLLARAVARCARARLVGLGGRGGGFMRCASLSEMVALLYDEMTGTVKGERVRQVTQARADSHVVSRPIVDFISAFIHARTMAGSSLEK